MLIKLLKYEFKASARMYGGMYLAVIAAAVLLGVNLGADVGDNQTYYSQGSTSGVLVFAYVGLCIALAVITLYTIVRRFKGNLLGREGYLMHTLPVNTRQLVGAKFIASVVWGVCGILVGCVSVAVLLLFLVMRSGTPLSVLMQKEWNGLFAVYVAGVPMAEALAVVAIIVLASGMCLILCIYASIMVGSLAKKHAAVAGIGAFLAFSMVQGWIQNLPVYLPNQSSERLQLWSTTIVNAAICAICGLLYFALTMWLMNEKLDLE